MLTAITYFAFLGTMLGVAVGLFYAVRSIKLI
ncbi:MAG: cytochrome B6-F complex subunit VI (PetL) [Acaryochloridaceae cyanobacterium RL_2_7]|nr:cytochrome B6-F complex subunit VI (PetL) [Acaryochloridaceae cyanobacterium RL_2_7]